jgi:ribosomal protein L28
VVSLSIAVPRYKYSLLIELLQGIALCLSLVFIKCECRNVLVFYAHILLIFNNMLIYIVSCLFRTRRSWKPNVQEKRLFSYIHDRHIRVKVTTHALGCIDKARGIDEYLLETPYNKMDTEMGIVWKAKIEKMYSELAGMEVGFFPPEEESKIEQDFDDARAAKKEARREARRALAKKKQLEAGSGNDDQTTEVEDTKDGVSPVAV